MTQITVAALQLALGSFDEAENIAAVSALVEQAAGQGAQIVLPPELFSGPYFCKTEEEVNPECTSQEPCPSGQDCINNHCL